MLNDNSPVAFCLQETKIKINDEQTFKNYHSYYHSTESGHGGVAILIKGSISHSHIPLNTNIQAVAARIDVQQRTFSLCSIYIPPNNSSDVSIEDLHNLISQLPAPVILMGDFNAHNGAWGAVEDSPRGAIIEKFILNEDLILLNNKHHTFFRSGYSSLLDLTLCHPSLFMDLECTVFEDTCGSDHCPIKLTLNTSDTIENERIPQWNFKKANWSLFNQSCIKNINPDKFTPDSVEMALLNNDEMAVFTELLLNSAIEAIPQTSPNPKKKPKPYFDEECKNIIDERKDAFKKFKKVNTPENVKHYQIMRAKCRRVIKQKKRSTWRQYVSSINSNTPIKKV